jgi:hypothetical protein
MLLIVPAQEHRPLISPHQIFLVANVEAAMASR